MSDMPNSSDLNSNSQDFQKMFEDCNKQFDEEVNQSISKARDELKKIEEKWDLILSDLAKDTERQLSPKQIIDIKNNLRADDRLVYGHYLRYIRDTSKQNELYQDWWSFFIHTDSKIDTAVQRGEQNYRNKIFDQSITSRREWGIFFKNLGINVGFLAAGALSTYFGIKFSGFCP
jgi:hypothetical protein